MDTCPDKTPKTESREPDSCQSTSTISDRFAATALAYLHRLPRATYPETAAAVLLPLPSGAVFKSAASDFQVDEILPFAADGDGHHLLLHIRKERRNTTDIQKALSVLVGCRQSDIGYSGLKDFHAVTTQWFTAPLTAGGETSERVITELKEGRVGECLKWFESLLRTGLGERAASVEIISIARHQRKLRQGTHRRNRFKLVLRGCDSHENFEQRLKWIQQSGFPNYFGLQRFGRGASNLRAFHRRWGSAEGSGLKTSVASGKRAKGRLRSQDQMTVSAMRSLVFNLYCASRVADDSWLSAGLQEPLLVGDGNSFFLNDSSDDTVQERVESGKLATSGPLFGQIDASEVTLASRLQQERDDTLSSLNSDSLLSSTLGRLLGPADSAEPGRIAESGSIFGVLGLRHRRRALRRFAHDLCWRWLDETTLELCFELATGTYATALLHQLGDLTDGSQVVSGNNKLL